MAKKVSEQLWECAKHIEKGWCQHMLRGPNGSVCAVGAIVGSVGRRSNNSIELQRRLAKAAGIHIDQIVSWNNDPKQTQGCVRAAFEIAALEAEMEEAAAIVTSEAVGTELVETS